VYDRPNSRFVASFMGMSNILRGVVEGSGPDRTFRLADGGRIPVARSADGVDAREIAMRPESLHLVALGSSDACFEGDVTFATMVGGRTVYEVQMPSATISVEMQRDKKDLAIGSRVGVAVDPDNVVLLSV
jgi:multiple sugar transport system ATP-binding protein